MSNDTFAHFVYGIPVKLTRKQRQIVDTYQERFDELGLSHDADVGADDVHFAPALVEMNELRKSLRKKYKLESDLIHLQIVDEDADGGSESEAGTAFLGVGVLVFPTIDDPEMEAAVKLLHAAGADWHSWVT